MTSSERTRNLSVPSDRVDVVLDTDAFNDVDGRYAISYLLRSSDKLNTKAIYAALYTKRYMRDSERGMENSYKEIKKMLSRLGESCLVYRGANEYLSDEYTPVVSDAACDIATRVFEYSPENPLYILASGAITNVASAILLNPKVAENAVVVWLGGCAPDFSLNREFNLMQDIAAARVVLSSGVPLVQLPCEGVVSDFTISRQELEALLVGKSEISDYLARITVKEMEKYRTNETNLSTLGGVAAVAWLLNDGDRFMLSRIIKASIPTYKRTCSENPGGVDTRCVYQINKDAILSDLVKKLTEK